MKPNPDRIKQARLLNGLRQEDLADKLGCSRRSIIGWEHGDHEPVPRLLRQLSVVTGVSIPWLLGEESHGVDRQDP